MRFQVTGQAHPYIQNKLVRFVKSAGGEAFADIIRFAIYEFDEPVRLHDIVVRLENIEEGANMNGDIFVDVFFEYKRTAVVLSDVTTKGTEYPIEGSNYGSYLLRRYTYLVGSKLEVMQGAFLEGSGVAGGSSTEVVHEHMPSTIPANSRIVFRITDQRSSEQTELLVEDVVRATLGVVVSSGGMF